MGRVHTRRSDAIGLRLRRSHRVVGLFDHETLDVSIDVAAHGTKEPMAGNVGLVGGQVMLSKGLTLEPGYQIDALDAPVLSMRLVMIVLKRVFPKGPDQVVGPTEVDHTEWVGIKVRDAERKRLDSCPMAREGRGQQTRPTAHSPSNWRSPFQRRRRTSKAAVDPQHERRAWRARAARLPRH